MIHNPELVIRAGAMISTNRRIGASYADVLSKNPSEKKGKEDADVMAYFKPLDLTVYVQVKKHDAGTVTGDWAVDQITEYKEARTREEDVENTGLTAFWVISMADDFSTEAYVKTAKENMRLIPGVEFCKMILDAGIDGIPG